MNIQRKNSAHDFRMQGEREQTLVKTLNKFFFSYSFFFVAHIIPILILYLFPKFYVTVILIFSVMMNFAHTLIL